MMNKKLRAARDRANGLDALIVKKQKQAAKSYVKAKPDFQHLLGPVKIDYTRKA